MKETEDMLLKEIRYLRERAERAEARALELERELEEWRTGKRVRSTIDTTLEGFGVDDISELWGQQ